MNSLIKKIQNFSHLNNIWKDGDKIVLGVSGGPDSVCLLEILVKLTKKKKFKLIIAHINYGLREKDSDKDEIFVRKLAEEYGLKVEVLNAKKYSPPPNPPPKERERMIGNHFLKENRIVYSENELRDIRYNFFEEIKKENNFNLIAVAHNKDDQAETILMRLIRGSGLLGLRSMQAKNNNIIRPLLDISRLEIINYLKENKLTYRTDKTNKENKYLRNKIRNKLIPLIERECNSKIKQTLAGAVSNIALDYDFILTSSEKYFKKINFNEDKNIYFFGVNWFLKIHRALQNQILRKIFFSLRGNLNNIENNHLVEILKIIKSQKNKSQVSELGGLKIERKGDIIYISVLSKK